MQELEYPFDSDWILKKKKSIKRQLLDSRQSWIEKKIAVLGGSTTSDIVAVLDLFLLNAGIKVEFYESEYNKYWEDIMFDNKELESFSPDLIWIHTTGRNIVRFPDLDHSEDGVNHLLDEEYGRFEAMWERIAQKFSCPIIQNNFEQPYYRLLGNADTVNICGRLNYINRLNERFHKYAREHQQFYIHDINYIASCYGIQKWAAPFYWYMYKYAMAVTAIPEFAYNLATIIKSILGKNKKAFAVDLDNTLWGGIVGEDGPEQIEIGHETAKAEMFTEFQQYLKAHKKLGVLLTINSKNDESNALAGLARPDSILHAEDFVSIKANWDTKDRNLLAIASELNIGVDSIVFVDDNPAERHIVRETIEGVAVPEIGIPEQYIQILDRSGFFEVTNLSEDDRKRSKMYMENHQREQQKLNFKDYREYLLSLKMKADIKPFAPEYMSRIAQLTNKSNQFNLTTLRCTQSDIEHFAADSEHITLYGKLEDRFGDNGVVAVTSGHIENKGFHIDLWLMSCRVLKRNMECAMMDELVRQCGLRGIEQVWGYYYPTAKNHMVEDFYGKMGFNLVRKDTSGAVWQMNIQAYQKMNDVINVNGEKSNE